MYKIGVVFDISHYMLEDGPGIRTNVFLKGCPLRCKWCSNVFGLEKQKQLSFVVSKCVGCGACISACNYGAISMTDEGRVSQDFSKCINCLECISRCQTGARVQVGKEMSSKDVYLEIQKDRNFYRRGNGGVTLSGGEILMQAEFASEILRLCSDNGINTAIETSAFGKWEDLSSLIKLSDTVFIDCKCIESKRHKEITGVDNSIILENITQASKLCHELGSRLIVRLPLIPTMNDSDENIIATGEFVKSLEGDPLLNILPYHNFGVAKYETIGKKCATEDLELLKQEQITHVRNLLDRSGIAYSIGGYDI